MPLISSSASCHPAFGTKNGPIGSEGDVSHLDFCGEEASWYKFAKAAHNQIQEAVFENRRYHILSNYDRVLTAIYGADYMQLPAEEDRQHAPLLSIGEA